jgi:hypothetical protein
VRQLKEHGASRHPPNRYRARVSASRTEMVLTMVAERLSDFGPAWSAEDIDGPLLRGPGSVGVILRDNHTDHDAHLDLDLVLNVDRPAETTLSDCVTGYGGDPVSQWRQAVDQWAGLTVATAVELMNPANTWADHMHGDDPRGVPGWHTIQPGFVGFGSGKADRLAQWAVETPLLPMLAAVLDAAVDREFLNGVKILFGGKEGSELAEVRINGFAHERASSALLALPWPRARQLPVFAKTFVLLVHRETVACGKA